jgi:hypothetical protein
MIPAHRRIHIHPAHLPAGHQHGKLNGTPGFIFVQTMSPLADYRNVPSARRDGSKLDRSLHVMYMTWEEFTTYVL